MPRLLLEGKSITELLERVRDEHGPEVRIVSADRVRSGGIGGFFTRESYALTVELSDDGLAGAGETIARPTITPPPRNVADVHAPGDPQAPGTLLDLAAAIDAAEAAETGVVLGTASMHATAAGAARTSVAAPPPAPALSTSGAGFAEILARLAALEAAEAAQVTSPAGPAPSTPLALDAAGWQRLRDLLHDVCGIDLPTESGALVLVITPPAPAPSPMPAGGTEAAQPHFPAAIPRQGRHRRSAVDEAVAAAIAAN